MIWITDGENKKKLQEEKERLRREIELRKREEERILIEIMLNQLYDEFSEKLITAEIK
jgi:hypothetical protein